MRYELHQVRLNIPTGNSESGTNITEGTPILNITPVGQGVWAQGLDTGLDGHVTSGRRCNIEGSAKTGARGNPGD